VFCGLTTLFDILRGKNHPALAQGSLFMFLFSRKVLTRVAGEKGANLMRTVKRKERWGLRGSGSTNPIRM
jgi:hypothetical protein